MSGMSSAPPFAGPSATPFAIFEDNLGVPANARLLDGYITSLDCAGPANASAFFAAIEAHRARGHWISLNAHYELGSAFELNAPQASSEAVLARALVFTRCIRLEGDALREWWRTRLAALSPQQQDAGLLSLVPVWSRDAYCERVERVLDYIRSGDCYQTNLTFALHGQSHGHPEALYARLRETQPVQHGALVFDGKDWLLSRSPELFFARTGDKLVCRPMKGTAARGTSTDEDSAHGEALLRSEKNRAENLMIVDLIRNDLGRLAAPGKVHVDSLFELERYATVFQLTSTISAEGVEASLHDIFAALFPCGSITGAPKLRAMQILDELEDDARGPYCGALGWLAPDGDCHFNVPIRTLRVDQAHNCRLDVGSGIVADSIATTEYEECLTKARFVSDDSLQLIETLRCEPVQSVLPFPPHIPQYSPYPLLSEHLSRLAKSARALHFAFDETHIIECLCAHAATLSRATHRVRLLLSRDGSIDISSAVLNVVPDRPRVGIADFRLDAEDPRLRHKTTARSFYDHAIREASAAGLFDLLFFNTHGELCEGARSNVFIERDGRLLTPPLRCGLLPGVMRARLLAEGRAEEQALALDDLKHAKSIWIANALRGLLEVHVEF